MRYPEHQLQVAVARFLAYEGVLWFHPANERKTTKPAGQRLRDAGVRSGVSDVLIFEPRGKYHGLCVELKIKPNKPTKAQLKWLEDIAKKGWSTAVCYNFDEFLKVYRQYLQNK